MHETQNEKFYELLKGFHAAILTTRGGDTLHVRPMTFAKIEEDCRIWFVTDEYSLKVEDIEADPRAYVTCQEGRSSFLSLSGKATVVRDRDVIKALWKEPFKVWFPKGADDPAIALIRFDPERGEFWDSSGLNKARYLFQAVKAYVTHTVPHVEQGEQHGTVKF